MSEPRVICIAWVQAQIGESFVFRVEGVTTEQMAIVGTRLALLPEVRKGKIDPVGPLHIVRVQLMQRCRYSERAVNIVVSRFAQLLRVDEESLSFLRLVDRGGRGVGTQPIERSEWLQLMYESK